MMGTPARDESMLVRYPISYSSFVVEGIGRG
jgi:hypothetical protein